MKLRGLMLLLVASLLAAPAFGQLTVADVKAILREAPGVIVADEPENNVYPMPIEATGKDATYVGRIREDDSVTNGLNLWVVADNLRKGAATNAVQIAEVLVQRNWLPKR